MKSLRANGWGVKRLMKDLGIAKDFFHKNKLEKKPFALRSSVSCVSKGFIERIMFTLLFVSISNVSAVQTRVRSGQASTYIDLFLENDERMHKDPMHVSGATPECIIERWDVLSQASEEYLSSFKQNKKVYREVVSIALTGQIRGSVSISSFVTSAAGKTMPFAVTVPIDDGVSASNVYQEAPVSSSVFTQVIEKSLSPDVRKTILSVGCIIVLLLLLILNILSMSDWGILFGGGILAPFVLTNWVLLCVGISWCVCASVWFFRRGGWVHCVIGVLCASAILPMLVSGFLESMK